MPHPVIEILDHEHRVIESVLEAIETANSVESDWSFYERTLTFLAAYAERIHHRKEEQLLFKAMVAAGIPSEGGPIGCMLGEHVEARDRLSEMQAALSSMDIVAMRRASASYCTLLREHIAKEDNILYPMAEQSLSPEVLAELHTAMRSRTDDEENRDELEALASRLRRRAFSL